MSETDTEYNPLIDDEQEASSQDSDESLQEEVLALKQRLVNTQDRVTDLEGVLESMELKERELRDSVDILRGTLRRLRFANQRPNERFRRDNSFFDAARRKFLTRWDGNMEYLASANPEHLGFLAILLDLPKDDASNQNTQ